ncbi:HAUS augmin-like complex subunit 4 [Anas platyrhynchos]|uniref:HAUS augmin-like complex subunit 4 n=1 Tax=Anas platyrhynchos TaxID=8839 RepID=UPI003AF25D4C
MTDLEAELLGPALPLPPPEELLPHPGLGRLLAALGAGPEGAGPEGAGLGAAGGRSLRRAEAELGRQRASWLAHEGLWGAVLELLREPRPQEAPPTLELALALAELRLGPPPLAALLPPPQDPAPLRQRLLPLVERRLAGKAGQLADYFRGRGRDVTATDDVIGDVTAVAEELAAQRRRLEAATARRRRLAGQLESVRRLYPQVLGRCGALLGRLQEERAAGAELERRRGLYLEAKGAATLLKIRLEELTLLLDTYRPEVLEAHRVIRSRLEAELSRAEAELSGAREALGALRALGPGFQEAAAEYGRLRERLRHRRWALRQLHRHDGDVSDDASDDVSDDVTKDGGPA